MISSAKVSRYSGSVPRWKLRAMNCATAAVWLENCRNSTGRNSRDEAKMTGMTPAMLTFSGM